MPPTKSYSLVLNTQKSTNIILNTNSEKRFLVNFDVIFRDETATHFLVEFEFTSLTFAGNVHNEPLLLSLNLPTHHHFNQSASPSTILGVINLVKYANNQDVFRANVSDNFPVTIQRPTDGILIVKILELNETLVAETFPEYITIIKLTPVHS